MPVMRAMTWMIVLCCAGGAAAAATAAAAGNELDDVAAAAVRQAKAGFSDAKIKDEDLALTVIDLRDSANVRTGSFRGDEPIYPASVIKLFYLAAAHRWLEDGKLADTDELRRMLRDMIVDSSNDATGAVVDALSGVGNGEPLAEAEMTAWAERRHAVNRYFASLGYAGINVCQKAYAEGPYGRERVFLGPKFENRNKLTTNATARLMAEIVTGKAVTPERSRQMMDLLKRDPTGKPSGPDDQDTGYTAKALPPGSRLWSKAGWTSTARHDAAYVESPDGLKFVLVIFTTGHARQRDLLPAIAREVMEGLRG
jgi:beta-lactamase class A